jgi:rhodanese-related sulfurtransferase
MPGYNTVTAVQLMRLIGTPQLPVILDVRTPEDLDLDRHVIPTARRIAAQQAATVAAEVGGRAVVTVCERGAKLSEGAAALLRCAGIAAEVLEGGWQAWRAAGLPAVPVERLPEGGGSGLWVTRHRPKIDRIACPWLIRRFIDPGARFLYVTPAEVAGVASRFDAIPFDVTDVAYSHRGAECTFDALLDDFGLHTQALDRLALVIRGADTDRHDLAPQAAGLLAVSVGLSRLYRDDLDQLAAGMGVYDALYRWARDGFDEGHDWPAGRAL